MHLITLGILSADTPHLTLSRIEQRPTPVVIRAGILHFRQYARFLFYHLDFIQ